MKKLFEILQKLFKNKIFKKVTMSIVFVVMCSVACFLNWKAVVGAEDGDEPYIPNNTFVFHFNENEHWKNSSDPNNPYPCGKITKIDCEWKPDWWSQVSGSTSIWEYSEGYYDTEFSTTCPDWGFEEHKEKILLVVQVSFSDPNYRPVLCYASGDPVPSTDLYEDEPTVNGDGFTRYYIKHGRWGGMTEDFYFRPPTCTLNYDENTCGWPGGGNNEGPFGKIEKVETKVGSEDYSEAQPKRLFLFPRAIFH